jgi:hypothetical protein
MNSLATGRLVSRIHSSPPGCGARANWKVMKGQHWPLRGMGGRERGQLRAPQDQWVGANRDARPWPRATRTGVPPLRAWAGRPESSRGRTRPGGPGGGGRDSQRETFVRSKAKSPRHGVLVRPELHGVEEQLHQSCLCGVLALVRIAKSTLAKASKNRPEDGEHRAKRRAVASRERGHRVLDLFTLGRLHRFSGLVPRWVDSHERPDRDIHRDIRWWQGLRRPRQPADAE